MRKQGFKEVYELDGGIMKWRGANLPETTESTSVSSGMSILYRIFELALGRRVNLLIG